MKFNQTIKIFIALSLILLSLVVVLTNNVSAKTDDSSSKDNGIPFQEIY